MVNFLIVAIVLLSWLFLCGDEVSTVDLKHFRLDIPGLTILLESGLISLTIIMADLGVSVIAEINVYVNNLW